MIACLRPFHIFASVWQPFFGAPYLLQFITAMLGMMRSKNTLASFSIHPVGDFVILEYLRLIVLLRIAEVQFLFHVDHWDSCIREYWSHVRGDAFPRLY